VLRALVAAKPSRYSGRRPRSAPLSEVLLVLGQAPQQRSSDVAAGHGNDDAHGASPSRSTGLAALGQAADVGQRHARLTFIASEPFQSLPSRPHPHTGCRVNCPPLSRDRDRCQSSLQCHPPRTVAQSGRRHPPDTPVRLRKSHPPSCVCTGGASPGGMSGRWRTRTHERIPGFAHPQGHVSLQGYVSDNLRDDGGPDVG